MHYTLQPGQPGEGMEYNVHKPLPYPIFLDSDLRVDRKTSVPEVGDKLIGFQKFQKVQKIRLHIEEFLMDPSMAEGMFPVFSDGEGFYSVEVPITRAGTYEKSPA